MGPDILHTEKGEVPPLMRGTLLVLCNVILMCKVLQKKKTGNVTTRMCNSKNSSSFAQLCQQIFSLFNWRKKILLQPVDPQVVDTHPQKL
jgi:hypothetical protein